MPDDKINKIELKDLEDDFREEIIRLYLDGLDEDYIRRRVFRILVRLYPRISERSLAASASEIVDNILEAQKKREKKARDYTQTRYRVIKAMEDRREITPEEAKALRSESFKESLQYLGPEAMRIREERRLRKKRELEAERTLKERLKKRGQTARYKKMKEHYGVSAFTPWRRLKPGYRRAMRELAKEKYGPEIRQAWKDYRYELAYIKDQYNKGYITRETFLSMRKKLRKEYLGQAGGRKIRKLERGLGYLGRYEAVHGKTIQDLLPTIFLLLAGAFFSYWVGCMWMMFAFISWSALCLIPEPLAPKDLKDKGIQLNLKLSDLRDVNKGGGIRKYFKNYNSGLGLLRSLLKITAIMLFVAAVKFCMLPFQGILLPVIAFIGYFCMEGRVDGDNPATVIESTLRFAILGCFVIPFWIFWSQFNSLSLAFIALAFFAVPPVNRTETEGERDIMSLFSKLLFFLFMMVALFGSGAVVPGWSLGPDWELHGALKVMFIYFWLVCGIAGFFSSPETRPATGLLMLLVATVIYGMSAGTQDVGMGLFGPYFPQVFKTITAIMKPITEAFGQISGTFGTAWQLLVNPVAFANQMMNSSYSKDPLSKVTGPLGVEIDGFRTTPIYPYSPFSAIVKIRNRGASDAGNIVVNISAFELWSPKEQKISVGKQRLVLGELGFKPYSEGDIEVLCYDEHGNKASDPYRIVTCSQSVDEGEPLKRLDIRQVIFRTPFDSSKEFGTQGLTCETVNKYALRESRFRRKWGIQFIPLTASVAYDYNMGSTLDVSFISKDEWSRMTEDEEAFIPQRKESATNTNSPAQLKLDTLEQPIREGTPFHIGLALESSQKSGRIADVYSIILTIPAEMAEYFDFCMPETDGELGGDPEGTTNPDGSITLEWSNKVKKRTLPFNIIFCNFHGLDLEGKAGESFLIQAKASFRFMAEDTEITNVEWGGGVACCIKDSHCPYPDLQVCNQNSEQCELKKEGEEIPYRKLGDAEYCAAKKQTYPDDQRMWCGEGEGKCSLTENECKEGLECMEVTINDEDTRLCCYPGKEEDCKEAYLANIQG